MQAAAVVVFDERTPTVVAAAAAVIAVFVILVVVVVTVVVVHILYSTGDIQRLILLRSFVKCLIATYKERERKNSRHDSLGHALYFRHTSLFHTCW